MRSSSAPATAASTSQGTNRAKSQSEAATLAPEALRFLLAERLRQYRDGAAIAPWHVSGHRLRLIGNASIPVLRCDVAIPCALDDGLARHILEHALVCIRHFDGRVLVDKGNSRLLLLRQFTYLTQDTLWHGCEQMVNQADVWVDVLSQWIGTRRFVPSSAHLVSPS